MKREIIISQDGSPTIYVGELNEHYHSVFGARAESRHIFIEEGMNYYSNNYQDEMAILEIGLGTGLNAYLSLNNLKSGSKISYYGVEKYPLKEGEWRNLDYTRPEERHPEAFHKIHECTWEAWHELVPGFHFYKTSQDLKTFSPLYGHNIIYFDAFAPDAQPDLWSTDIFRKMYNCLIPGGILLTYSVKGTVKRNLSAAGFSLSKLPGPKGKRHILRASK